MSAIRIPPDSTGKKIGTTERRHIGFDNNITLAQIGDVVTGQTSGASGTVTAIATEGFVTGSGTIHFKDFTDVLFQDNEVLEINSTPISSVALEIEPQTDVHFQQVILSDPDNPHNRQKVDRFGATVNTFTDGSPIFTPFGAMSVGQAQVIKDYRFAYDGENELFWDSTAGGGSLSYEANRGTMLFSTGTTLGDNVFRTSNYYHPYIPGVGTSIEMSIELGDTGKANLRRCWGLFDANNGLFFDHDDTGLNIVVRSDATGSIIETKINQADFNSDKVDGSDAVGLVLDVTKGNVYYIDFQWLGAGRVNFGMLAPSGERVLMHSIQNANTNSLPYMATATLPLRVEQVNTGTVVSTSEMRFLCGVVKHTSLTTPETEKFTLESGLLTTVAEKPAFSVRPALTINGKTNRVTAQMETLYFINTSAEPALLTFVAGASLTGPAFGAVGTSALELDTTASAFSGGKSVRKIVVAPGHTEVIKSADESGLNGLSLYLNADGSTQPTMTLTVKSLTGTATTVNIVANWGELRF